MRTKVRAGVWNVRVADTDYGEPLPGDSAENGREIPTFLPNLPRHLPTCSRYDQATAHGRNPPIYEKGSCLLAVKSCLKIIP